MPSVRTEEQLTPEERVAALERQLVAVNAEHQRQLAALRAERDAYKQKVDWFQTQLERLRYDQKTPREHVDPRQIQLAFEPFAKELLGPAVTPPDDPPAPEKGKPKRKVTPHGRRNLAAVELDHLPTLTLVLNPEPIPEGAVKVFTETSWRLGFRKASWIRIKIERPAYAVPPSNAPEHVGTAATFCDETGSELARATDTPSPIALATNPTPAAKAEPISTFEQLASRKLILAPLPHELIARGLPTPELLAHLIFGKFGLHLPYHRMEQQCSAEGISLTRGTMCGWVEQAFKACKSLVDAMEQDARAHAQVILTDATGVLVQDNDKCRHGHFWVYVADRDHVVFRFSAKHSSDEPKAFFKAFAGVVMSDASSVFNALFAGEQGPAEANCWSHARRYFFKALDSEHRPEALVGMGFCNQLFDWEQTWKKEPPARRKELRQQHSVPLLERMRRWMNEQRERVEVVDNSRLRKALNYAENQWSGLTYFVQDGRVPLDNNESERQLRRIAVGRKNWLFVGDDETAPWTALFVTLLASCQLHGIEGEGYLRDLFRVLPSWPHARVLELAPKNWRATRGRLSEAELVMPLGPLTVPAKV